MDLSILQRSLNKENIDSDSQNLVRPKLSFSVASLLASAARTNAPRTNDNCEDRENDEEEDINPEDSDNESDVTSSGSGIVQYSGHTKLITKGSDRVPINYSWSIIYSDR